MLVTLSFFPPLSIIESLIFSMMVLKLLELSVPNEALLLSKIATLTDVSGLVIE